MVFLHSFISASIFAQMFSLFAPSPPPVPSLPQGLPQIPAVFHQKRVCNQPAFGEASCHIRVHTDAHNNAATDVLPSGLSPAQLHASYATPATSAAPPTVAIVSAYDHPRIKGDLDIYNSTFGLPAFPSCSASITEACFQKVNQYGNSSGFPRTNGGWAIETALDVQTIHQTCQNCKLILVEANSSSYYNLMAAVDTAVRLGATIVSGSWGSGEFYSETGYDGHFNKPGVLFTFAGGDNGYGAEYPATSPYVTAVGGTTLSLNANGTRASETVWGGTGSGCSLYEPKPAWQTDPACDLRTANDVSAVADPQTGAAIYSSVYYSGARGWFKVGGTSLSTPLIAGIYALNGKVPAGAKGASLPYARHSTSNLHDIASGSNGDCEEPYLCTALLGYDAPTGLGTPSGISAF